MPDLELSGCRTRPLLSYLKALGVFRHAVAADATARLWWDPEGFAILRGRLETEGLAAFFLDDYEPSPITSPWNSGSGYHGTYKRAAIETLGAIAASASPRLTSLRTVIEGARALLEERFGDTAIDSVKDEFLAAWRAVCPEPALEWLDAVCAYGEAGPTMNPLLGTGGNDGNFDFSVNFLARLIECLPHLFGGSDDARELSRLRLRAALYDEPAPLCVATVGMFDPGGAGLPNSSSSAVESAIVNPWDFVFLLEGASLFGGGVARRLSAERAVFPFTVLDASRIGLSLQPGADAQTRGETWLPVWRRPASLPALRRLLAEGRTQDGRHQARAGREMMRAVADVGVDRGITAFERVVYAERFGRNYVAVSAGSVDVRAVRSVELLRSSDTWLQRVRSIDTASVRACLGRLERAAAEVSTGSDERAALERWLLALGETQLAVGRRPASRAVSEPSHVRPLGGLPRRIVTSLPDSAEHRLARALACVGRGLGELGLRSLVEPVTPARGGSFAWDPQGARSSIPLARAEVVLIQLAASAADALAAVPPQQRARLADIEAFLVGETDDERLVRLAFVFTLCAPCEQRRSRAARSPGGIDRLYALARLATCDREAQRPGGSPLPVQPAPEVVPVLASGHARAAARLAARRLRADGLAPLRSLEAIERRPAEARRIAAALAFPLHPEDRAVLELASLTPEPWALTDLTTTEGALT